MLENNNQTNNTNEFINKRKQDKMDSQKRKSIFKRVLLIIFICLVLGVVAYFISDISNVKTIEVKGNIYIKDEDIIELSEISNDSKYLLSIPSTIENKIVSHSLIKYCEVEKLEDCLIRINVVEKKIIGYAYENNENVLILDDDSRMPLDKSNLYLIEKVPLIEGFSKEDIVLIIKELDDVDYKMINEISEIHFFPALKYQNVEMIMRDGNYVFTSAYGLNLLNKYYDIDSSVSTQRNNCYYFEDISGNAYMSACPWEKVEEEIVTEEQKPQNQ